jgi:nitrite reductase (NADH) small subunit
MIESMTENPVAEPVVRDWFKVAAVSEFPEDGGIAVKYKDTQIAVFNFTAGNTWYATQNMCPHRNEMALARGIIGDSDGQPKVSCPFHKRNFSLESGTCLSGDAYTIKVYPVKILDGFVYVGITG